MSFMKFAFRLHFFIFVMNLKKFNKQELTFKYSAIFLEIYLQSAVIENLRKSIPSIDLPFFHALT